MFTPQRLVVARSERGSVGAGENPAPRPTPVCWLSRHRPRGWNEGLTPEEYGTQRDRTTVRHEHIEDVLADKAVRAGMHRESATGL